MKTIYLLLSFVFFISQFAYADEQTTNQLFEKVKGSATEKVGEQSTLLRYCPDNMCLEVEYPNGLDHYIIADFVLLFFYNSGWLEFTNPNFSLPSGKNVSKELIKHIPYIYNKYRYLCKSKESGKLNCAIRRMKKKYGIKTFLVERTKVTILGKKVLSRHGLSRRRGR